MDSMPIIESEDLELKAILFDIRPLPQWFDAERISKGQKFYMKFATPVMTLLCGLSLTYCYTINLFKESTNFFDVDSDSFTKMIKKPQTTENEGVKLLIWDYTP